MNVFYLDEDPRRAALYLRDNHINKMPTESGQLLSCWAEFWPDDHLPPFPRMEFPKSVFKHPSLLWLTEGHDNVLWLLDHTDAMHEQHALRFGDDGTKHLKSKAMVKALKPWLLDGRELKWTEPKQALGPNGDKYRVDGDPVAGYRRYYVAEKLYDARYTEPGRRPDWAPRPMSASDVTF